MSIKVMSWAWTVSIPGPQKLMLLAIADHCNDEGDGAFPSVDLLAVKCTIHERTAQRTITKLEQAGILHVAERGAWRSRESGQKSNLYTIIGYKHAILGEDISWYLENARGGTHATPSGMQGVTPTPPLEVTPTPPLEVAPTPPLDAEGVTPTPPESSLKNQSSVINHQNQSSSVDDDDDNKQDSMMLEIIAILGREKAGRLIGDCGIERVRHACRYVTLKSGTLRNKRRYAEMMIMSGEEMAPIPTTEEMFATQRSDDDVDRYTSGKYADFIES